MSGYTVDVEALSELGLQMQRYLNVCAQSLERVEDLIERVSASWDGTAATAYQQRHRQWIEALGAMRQSLDEFKGWSANAEDAYRSVMAMNLRMAGE
ncbi:WXG100 family type VII secretion target [Mycobacterium sp. M1]|uniref:WXG100 family type VII secretion target n=1 Tax=Mycolicibacter acidiphilus TaxID=2835306 RepID=A0ABS5RKL2_9MYCO|nr:WXG100 family type VII secretion target [Mycolicibacter acidiphilus]MBS9534036.1 WXG100 family type VII secretion target [Mycolicibacter acidiphilus]